MEINEKTWNKFILENNGSFLQSYEWGEFQINFGRRVRRFGGRSWQAQFIQNKLPGLNKFYWYCPRGPVIKFPISNFQFPSFLEEIKKTAGNDIIFFRLGPEVTAEQWPIEQLNNLGFWQLPYDIEPSQTLILDIAKTENELLSQMHEKWRYNIQLGKRKGVIIKNYQHPVSGDHFKIFYNLIDKGTSDRKKIKHHSSDYYRKQLAIHGEGAKTELFFAEYDGEIIAANIVVFCGKRATYLHGATSGEHREVMAPHLLQWEQIKKAKEHGCTEYDFWGITNEHTRDKRKKSWEGFTRFKKGFGGREVNYIGYFDYPLNKPWYFLYRLAQKFRR